MKTYGTITWFKNSWIIEAEPHVVIRLRRVFPRVARKQDFLGIADTVEVSRELEWFLSRFPLQYKASADMPAAAVEGRLSDRARLHRDGESIVDKLLKGIQPATNFRLALPPRDYQKLAASLVLQTGGLLIADDMGLGKTVTSICVISDPRARPALVCTLTALPGQWESEFRKFAPSLTTHVLRGTKPYDLVKACNGRFPDVVLTSYSKLDGWAETLAPALNSVTWDECLAADTAVSLWPSGRCALVELFAGDRIASFDASGKLQEDRVVGITPKGLRQVWRLTLRDGRFLDCTDSEKIMTAAGWRYVSEIINEASSCDTAVAIDATHRHSSSVDCRDDARGCVFGSEAYASKDLDDSRSKTRSLRAIQSRPVEGLHPDAATTCAKCRIRADILYISDRNNPSLRILAKPLLPKRRRTVEKDGHPGVACFAGLGGLRLLVHGRRARAKGFRRDQHSLVSAVRGGASCGVVPCEGYRSGNRQSTIEDRQGVLDASLQLARGTHACAGNPPVHPGVHELQGNLPRASRDASLHILRQVGGSKEPEEGQGRRVVQVEGLPQKSASRLLPCTLCGGMEAGAQASHERAETIRDGGARAAGAIPGTASCAMGDVSNKRGFRVPMPVMPKRDDWAQPAATLQRLYASGEGSRSAGKESGLQSEAPTDRRAVRLVPERLTTEKRRCSFREADLRSSGLSGSPQKVGTKQELRVATHQLVSVERRGIQEVWDVETEKNHTLIANGFAVHNCQELRRGDTTLKGAAAALIARKVKYRTSLSGTPVYNMGGELHPVMEVTRPGSLGTKTEFALEWCTGDADNPGKLKIKDPKAMGTYLLESGLMIRRTKKDVGREVPELTRVPHMVDCDMKELSKIESKAVALAQVIMSKTQQARGQQMQASSELNNLVRQATGISKAPYCAEFIRMVAASEERVIVFLWHRECYTILMEALSDPKLGDLKPVMYSGSETVKQKQEAKDRFCGGDSRVLLMSLRSGAGIDGLQHHCRIGVFAELDWSPGVHEQAEARVARDGQPDPTLFYYLLSNSGSDPIISDMLGVKRGQIEGIRDPKGAFEHSLDADGQNVRKLAQAYLLKHTKSLPNGSRVVR